MFEVEILDMKKNKTFIKKFNDKYRVYRFVEKLKYSNKLKLLRITDNSYFYD